MIRVFALLFITSLLHAEVLEVKQLFNKKLVRVKSIEKPTLKTFYATTTLDESKIVDLSLRLSGFVEKIYANKRFASVAKGERLFTLYSQTLSEIKAELSLAKALGQKKLIHNLHKKLSLLKVGSNISADYTVDIKAPVSGIILEKVINEGSFIKQGALLYKIADISTIWVILQAYQKNLSFIKEGMDATIMIEGFAPIEAKVDFIYPFMNPQTKTVDVRIVLPNPNHTIYPNLFAKVALKAPSKKRLVLPNSAILTKGEKHYVYRPVGEGEFEPVAIEVLRLDSHTYEVKSGLKEGDVAIDKALFMLDADAITNGLYDSDDEEW